MILLLSLQIIAIILLTIASGFFSCSEVAFFSLPASKVRGFRFSKDPRKQQVARIVQRSKSLLVTIFMCNTIANVLLQNTTSDLFTGWILKVGFPLFLVLFVGELVPKYFGLIYNEKLSFRFANTIEWLEWIITPLRIVITKVAYMLSRLVFFFLKAEPPLSKEELAHILASSEGKGILHKEEVELIYGVLNLEDKQAKELMRPRSEMPLYDIEEPISKLVHLFSEEKASEVGIFEMPQEKMLGVVRAKDFFIRRSECSKGKDLLKILRQPFYVPETTEARDLLKQLREEPTDIAWVVDEYGATTGQIREQDLLSEVVASTALPESDGEYERIAKDTIVAQGICPLEDIRRLFKVELQSKHLMVTIGGYITERLGTIPTAGTTLQEEGLFMRVLSSDQTKIRKVYIQKRQP
jgi:CBS domain containing-hemolysin-like protein